MARLISQLEELMQAALQISPSGQRALIGIAGAPGSGKSTIADKLAHALQRQGLVARVVPMDGFHLDNRLLRERGLEARKGAPETFDLGGLIRLIDALRSDDDVYFPLFDRSRDIAVASADHVSTDCAVAILEGNYLLLDAPGWRDIAPKLDLSVFLAEPDEVIFARLMRRWTDLGRSPEDARARVEGNDMINARQIARDRIPADVDFEGGRP